ncbi:hypothetical protein STEG23_000896, partial [Scotinomys teguina]
TVLDLNNQELSDPFGNLFKCLFVLLNYQHHLQLVSQESRPMKQSRLGNTDLGLHTLSVLSFGIMPYKREKNNNSNDDDDDSSDGDDGDGDYGDDSYGDTDGGDDGEDNDDGDDSGGGDDDGDDQDNGELIILIATIRMKTSKQTEQGKCGGRVEENLLYTVKQKLTSQQSEETDQNQKGCPSEVVSSSDNTIGDLSVNTLQQIALEENDWLFQTKEPSLTVPPDTLGSDFDSGKVKSTDDVLPRTVSFRPHLKKDLSNVSCSTALEDCEASHWVGQSLEVRSGCRVPTISLHKLENVEQKVCLWNKDQINLSPRLTCPGKNAKTKEVILPSKFEQMKSKHKSAQKRRANQRCKSKPSLRYKGNESKDKQTLHPKKLNTSIGSSDASDFNLEELVHLSPFQQKMSNGSSGEINNRDLEESAFELSSSEDEPDDLYLPPYKHLEDQTESLGLGLKEDSSTLMKKIKR